MPQIRGNQILDGTITGIDIADMTITSDDIDPNYPISSDKLDISWKAPVANEASLPGTADNGDVAVTLDTGAIFIRSAGVWTAIAAITGLRGLVIPRGLWYGDVTADNFAIDGIRSANSNSNKEYAMDIPLGEGFTIVNIRTRQIFDGSGSGTIKLQKAENDDTSWTDVQSRSLTNGTTTMANIDYLIEDKMSVRVRISYTSSGGTYTYFYPTEIEYREG